MDKRMLLSNLDVLATAPGGVARLRELILTLAVQGKLVPQDPADEPANELLRRVANQKMARSSKVGKAEGESDASAAPYELPMNWAWTQLGKVVENMGSGWSPACEEGERIDPTKWAVLRTTAVQLNEYRPHEHKVIPHKLTPRPDIEVKNGDVLITRAGPLNRVGVSCWVNDTPPRLMLSDKIVRFHAVADEMLPAFVVLTLNAGWTKTQIESAKTGMAASQVNISQNDLKALWLPVCSKTEQSRIVIRVEELMRLCDALEAKCQLEAAQHAQLVSTLLGTLTASTTPGELADNWQRVAQHFDLLLDRPEAIDALEQTLLQLAVRGLLVPQDPTDEPASALLQKIRAEKDRLIAAGQIKRDKPLPAITDEEKPFELPVGWEWVRLADVWLSSFYGPRFGNDEYVSEGGIPTIRTTDMSNGQIALKQPPLVKIPLDKYEAYLVRKGDLLVTRSGSIGVMALFNLDMDAVPSAYLIRLRFPELMSPSYCFEYFMSELGQSQLGLNTTAVGVPNVSASKMAEFAFPLPPLAEQSRIVTRVTALRRLCADLRQRLADAQTTQSHLAQALVESTASV